MTVRFSRPSRPGFETIGKSDDFQEPATTGEERYDTDYARKYRQSIRVSEAIQKRLQEIASEEVAATSRGDEAKLRALATEADELDEALTRLHIARQGAFGVLEAAGAAGLAKSEAFRRTSNKDDVIDDTADQTLMKRDEEQRGRIRDPLGLESAFGIQNGHLYE